MPEPYIDLRSDTVTKPSAKMRAAMAAAEVGDDVYGEDPTINRLEERAAEMCGKAAALFVPTGTMGNSIGIKLHTKHGEEVICDSRAHVMDWELSMMAWFSGCLARPVQTRDGILSWHHIRPALRGKGPHNAPTALICLENTHNMAGGTVYPQRDIDEICAEAHALSLKVHMDGARVFNAAVATGTSVSRIVRDVDTVMFCLSKGLGAPVGSMLAGSADAIAEGRLYRKRLGGGMRQAGVLAAAGLIALEDSPRCLAQDHANARLLAQGLAGLHGVQIELASVQTNIVIFDISGLGVTTAEFSNRLREKGILANGISPTHMRMVTHLDVTRADCERALAIVSELSKIATNEHEYASHGGSEKLRL
jgi:threonine aldolase